MTSEPDETPRRRPPTIDLKATEVEAERPASTGEEAGAAAAAGDRTEGESAAGRGAHGDFVGSTSALRGGAMGTYAIAALAGALAMLALVAVLWVSGVLPPRGETVTPGGSEPLAAAGTKELSARLDKVEAALAAQQTALATHATQRPDAALASRIGAAEAETKSLGDSVAALNRRVDGIVTTAGNAAARADAAAAAVEAAKSTAQQPGVQRADLDALANRVAAIEGVTNRIAAVESAVKALSENVANAARRPASADDRAARTTVAAEALRAAVERGAPYQAEFAAVKSLGVDESVWAPLEPFAADGVPSIAVLARELTALTPALARVSGAAPSENSFLGRLQANAEKLVRVSPVDAPSGDDPGAIIARIDVDARRSDIHAALAEIGRLPDAARTLAAPWVKKAEARAAAIASSRRIAADALAALGKPAQQ